jgi:hypothetical protein
MMMRSLRALRPVREFAVPYDSRMAACVLVSSGHHSTWHLLCLWRLGHMHTRPQVANYPTVDEVCRQPTGTWFDLRSGLLVSIQTQG